MAHSGRRIFISAIAALLAIPASAAEIQHRTEYRVALAGLPIARAAQGAAFERHWLTAPELDPAAIAAALGLRATTAASPAGAAAAIRAALAAPGATIIHAPVTASGAHDVRRAALDHFDAQPALRAARGGNHD